MYRGLAAAAALPQVPRPVFWLTGRGVHIDRLQGNVPAARRAGFAAPPIAGEARLYERAEVGGVKCGGNNFAETLDKHTRIQ